MRSRSGAIHSDSTQDFLLMAELTQSKTGIFYDQTINKKIMNQMQKTQKTKVKQKKPKNQSSISQQNQKNLFKNFNFTTQSQQTQDQANELNKREQHISKVIHLGILTHNLALLKEKIQIKAKIVIDFFDQSRFIDLLMVSKADFLFKIWMFDADTFKEHKLAPTYFSKCHILYSELNQVFVQESIKFQQAKQFVQNYLSFLTQ